MKRSVWKTIFKVAALLGLVFYLIFALTLFNRESEPALCKKLDIYVNDPQHTGFITENEVRSMLISSEEFPEGQALDEVNLTRLERVLRSNPYIDEAKSHITPEGHIVLQLTPRLPVLHVLDEVGRDYYIDNHGDIMPRGYHTSNLLVLTGHVDSIAAGRLYAPVAMKIIQDSFWVAQVQEMHITPSGDIELTPRVGQHIIELGDTTKLEDKLNRMHIFYEEGLKKVGWDKYSRISLKYDGQVVCTRKNQ